jgi:transcriptional regulator with XRE-family HTH domain
MINLGNKIRELRVNKGLTQEQLATALNLSPQAISKWETGGGYPDVATLPVLAGYFGVSLDEMFEYDPEEVEEKIQKVLYRSRVEAHGFEETEKVLLEGIAAYPSGDILKRELLEHYAARIRNDGRTDLVENALDIGKRLIADCKDSFIYLGAMGDMADIYIHTGHYEEGKKLIESMPYRYHLDIYDRMRCSVMFLNGKDYLPEVRSWKLWAHQELEMVCSSEGLGFWEIGDYENALLSFEEAVNVTELLLNRQVPREYTPLRGPNNQGYATIRIAACLYKLGRNDDCDAALARAYNLIRGCYTDEQWNKWGEKRLEDYRAVYECMGLNEYKPCPF